MTARWNGRSIAYLALALAAIAVAARASVSSSGRHRTPSFVLAVGLGAAATLSKETAIVVLVGWALARRDRLAVAMAAGAIAVAGAWAVWLRLVLPSGGSGDVTEIGLPFVGLVRAFDSFWLEGTNRLGMVSTLGAIAVGAIALRRVGLRHALGPAIALNVAFVSVMNSNVLGIDFGGTRSTMPLLMLGLLALASTPVQARRDEADAPAHGATGIDGPGSAVGASSNR